MPVDTTHPQYDAATDRWKRCRHAFDGTDAVKAAGDDYLPRLTEQDDTEYKAYKDRALWFGATERTVQALLGFVFRRDPIIEFPESLQEQLKDVTLTGVPFDAFAKTAVREVLVSGRYGVLVDMAKSVEGEQKADSRPYLVAYSAEQIINWRTERRDGDTVLSLLVLSETVEEVDAADPFEVECREQWRVLRLDGNVYTVEVWQSVTTEENGQKKTSFVLKESTVPKIVGKPLDFIPFCFFGPTSITPDIEKPPLLDLVDVNFSHYRTSADLEHGRHFCGLPTAYALGFTAGTSLKIGSATAWICENHEAKVGYLEFTGQGLNALKEALSEKKQQMAELGSRILEEPRKGIEAADSIRMRQGAEQSALQSIAASISSGLSQLLTWHSMWAGADSSAVSAQLNRDFVDAEMDPQEFTALMAALQAGLISYETFYWNLQKAEVARPGVDVETEKSAMDADEERFRVVAPEPTDDTGNSDDPNADGNAGNE